MCVSRCVCASVCSARSVSCYAGYLLYLGQGLSLYQRLAVLVRLNGQQVLEISGSVWVLGIGIHVQLFTLVLGVELRCSGEALNAIYSLGHPPVPKYFNIRL